MIKPTAWFLGDSFVYGWGCRDRVNKRDKLMSQIVSKELNCEEVNLARYGYSNQNILNTLTTSLNKFKHGDYVVLFDSFSTRSHFVKKNSDYYENWPENTFFPVDERKLEEFHAMILEHASKLVAYYKDIFNSIVQYLNTNGINAKYFPSENNWWQKQRIERKIDINPDELGGHWSFKGHRTVAEWVIEELTYKTSKINKNII